MSIADICSLVPGAVEKIATLRSRNAELSTSIEEYESIVSDQAAQLQRMNQNKDDDGFNNISYLGTSNGTTAAGPSAQDLKKEEEEVRELEEKKILLEERVGEIERDIGGLMR